MSLTEHRFAALGTQISLFLAAPPSAAQPALEEAQEQITIWEQVFSRFKPDSELSMLNSAGGGECSAELFEVIELAVSARDRTEGRFDPTICRALIAAGYDRSFELITTTGGAPAAEPTSGGEVNFDTTSRTVHLPAGTELDLGGIAKGWIVDQTLALLELVGPALVNAGGDLACSPDSTEPWTVSVPGWSVDGQALQLNGGALATSGRDRRTWINQRGESLHHIIDPQTQTSAETDIQRVTVFAETCVAAEVAAKQLFLAGSVAAAVSEANELSIPALITGADDSHQLAGGLA